MFRQLLRCACPSLILLALPCLAPVCDGAPPEDAVGTWKLKAACPDGKARHCIVNVYREDDALKGTYVVDGVGKPARGVHFEQGKLIVVVDGRYSGQKYQITYTGRPEAGKVKGTARWAYSWLSGSFDFEGERIEQEVAQMP